MFSYASPHLQRKRSGSVILLSLKSLKSILPMPHSCGLVNIVIIVVIIAIFGVIIVVSLLSTIVIVVVITTRAPPLDTFISINT